jgi:hypothetical protein
MSDEEAEEKVLSDLFEKATARIEDLERNVSERDQTIKELREALKGLLPLADAGYQHHQYNHSETQEDRTALFNARKLIES